MKEMLYYPGFEVANINWLKFALLYFEEIRPIFPLGLQKHSYVGDSFLKVMDYTNLIRPYNPEYQEALVASTIALNEFEQYLRNPYKRSMSFGCKDINDKWSNPKYQTTTLFQEKYSSNFFDYCIHNRIASPCDEGIKISEELAFVYMSFLAEIISQNNEFEMITDVKKYSTILMSKNRNLSKRINSNIYVAKNNIEFNVPSNIATIPLDKFIELRSQKRFNEYRKGYMQEINKLIEAKEKIRVDYSLEELLSYKKDLIELCEQSFNMISTLTLSVYNIESAAKGKEANSLLLFANAYMGYHTIRNAPHFFTSFMEQLKNKHFARRYLAELKKQL